MIDFGNEMLVYLCFISGKSAFVDIGIVVLKFFWVSDLVVVLL